MKQLTQAIFIGQPDWVKSAAVNGSNGIAGLFDVEAKYLDECSGYWGYHKHSPVSTEFRYIKVGSGFDTKNWQNSAIDRDVDDKNKPQEPYFLMKGGLFYRHSYRGYSDFSAWAGVYDKDEAIAYAEKSGGSVIAKPARNFYHEPEEIDRMIERLQLIRQALRDSPNGY